MSSKTAMTFVDACLNGKAILADVDDWVDRWHETDYGFQAPTLDEFLGFSEDEGNLWVEKPASLGAIVAAHKRRTDVRTVLETQDTYALAARSVSAKDAQDVLQWLIARGRIPPRS